MVDRVELRRLDERGQLRALAESHSVDRADCQFPRHTTVLALGVLELLNQLDRIRPVLGALREWREWAFQSSAPASVPSHNAEGVHVANALREAFDVLVAAEQKEPT